MIRYARLGRVDLNVTDLQRSRRFYSDVVGLQEICSASDANAEFASGADACFIGLHQANEAGLKSVGWELADLKQLRSLKAALAERSVPYFLLPSSKGELGAVGVTDPTSGAVHIIYCAPESDRPHTAVTHTRIQRIGHVVIASPDADRAARFFCDVLGFRESDRIERGTIFLRPFATKFHHGLGIARSDRPHFHHLNLMVTDVDDIGRALHRLRHHGVTVAFGPGRHPVSGSVFLYFFDPDGLTLEYSFGMEEFDNDDPRRPRAWPAGPASVDAWSAVRHADTGRIGAIEVAGYARYLVI